MSSDFVLYDAPGAPSPRRVRMCLIEKGLPFTIKWLNLGMMDQKRPEYLRLNPTGMVPTLVHDGHAIFETNVINEYIDSIVEQPRLVPDDLIARTEMRMWFAFETDFAKPFRDIIYETKGKERLQNLGLDAAALAEQIQKRTTNDSYLRFSLEVMATPRNDAVIADRHEILLEKMGVMEERLSDGRTWLCGDQFTLADIALAPRIEMFPAIGIPDLYERCPNIGRFMTRLKARPSWAASAIMPEPGETERVVPAHQ